VKNLLIRCLVLLVVVILLPIVIVLGTLAFSLMVCGAVIIVVLEGIFGK